MKPLWLVGEHIEHSRSPAMHNAALRALGEGPDSASDSAPVYSLRPATAETLDAILAEAEATCAGINVTAPFKVAVARRYEAILDDDARLTGAVNTVVFREGRAVAALNTDVGGLRRAWRRAALVIEGRTVAIQGAGGAARAAVVAAQQTGARAVVLHARRAEAASALLVLAESLGLEAVAAAQPCGATVCVMAASAVDDPTALLSASLGAPGAVHDLRYGPTTVPLRDAALRAGHLYADGTSMLLHQGIDALAAFTGKALPEVAVAAMRAALARRA